MKTLDINWVTDSPMDFEYKKYLLLAYLQNCKNEFGASRLYPPLQDLVEHYRQLHHLKSGVEQMQQSFPKELLGFDYKNLQLLYEEGTAGKEHVDTISELMEFALPSVKATIEEGKEIYEFVEQHIEIAPVGVLPVYDQEGYVLITSENQPEVYVYQYHCPVIQSVKENLRAIHLQFICKEWRSISQTIEHIKLKLISTFRELPQPATFHCISKLAFPLNETLVPVVKRRMLKALV